MSVNSEEGIYAELPPSLRRKFARPTNPKQLHERPAVDGNLAGLVPVVAHGVLSTKLAHPKVPLENPAKQSDRAKKVQEQQRESSRKEKIGRKRRRSGRIVHQDMSTAQKQAMHDRPLARGKVSYDLMKSLHQLWLGYISDLLGLPLRGAMTPEEAIKLENTYIFSTSSARNEGPLHVETKTAQDDGFPTSTMQGWQAKLVKADFHGADVEVVRAKHPSLIGLKGIVVQETEGTMRIVTTKNIIKVVPKLNVTYAFTLPLQQREAGKEKDLRFELYGGNFLFRSADRASKKFKAKGTKGLDF